jgi:DNA-directed RNA polymerase subunit RPC12/RpoP
MLFKSNRRISMKVEQIGEVKFIRVGRWITVRWRKSGRLIINDEFQDQAASVDAADVEELIAALQESRKPEEPKRAVYKCLKCGGDTAHKMMDVQGWDGSCKNCGLIPQMMVGELVTKE